jgi:nucleotide-binding universal stress UspA family protein
MRERRGPAPNVASRADGKDEPVYREIVVGTDGSPTALHALDHAIHLAARETARLHIVTAYRPLTPDQIYQHQRGLPPHARAEIDEAYVARSMLGAAADRASEAGVPTAAYARPGDPASAILDVAEEVNADLVVVGSRGMEGGKRFLLGSVPSKVCHHCPCHLLIVHAS